MDQWLALVAFSIVSTGSPGPNNVLLWASGAAFGFRPTMPHILGTAVGIGVLALTAAAGLAVLLAASGAAIRHRVGHGRDRPQDGKRRLMSAGARRPDPAESHQRSTRRRRAAVPERTGRRLPRAPRRGVGERVTPERADA